MSDQILLEPEEKPVEEVRCFKTGVPLLAIPAWYATVNTRFVSQAAQKSAASAYPGVASDDAGRTAVVDPEAEPAIDELEIDELEVDDAEAEADEE